MTFLPSPLRERARLALALLAIALSAAIITAGATHAQGPDPDAKPGTPGATEVSPGPSEVKAPASHAVPVPPVLDPEAKPPSGPTHRLAHGSTPDDKVKPRDPESVGAGPQPGAQQSAPPPATPGAAPDPPASQPTDQRPTPAPAGERRRRVSTRAGVRERRALSRVAGVIGAASDAATLTEEASKESSFGPAQDLEEDDGGGSAVTRTVEEIVEVVPDSVLVALAGLLAISLVLAGASLLSASQARRLARQRRELLQEVGLLQSALLPPVPEQLGALHTSVAYRPADGPGAGGDFYDALPLPGGRAAFILGDVSGHGRSALERTAFLRYTLRAYLEAGLEPRIALQVGGRVIDQHLSGDFATVVLAVHDPATAALTFACAGHPAPIVVGPSSFEPVLAGSSPPLGIGLRTGLRQTTIPLAPGSVACLFTDGLTEARTETGILGRPRLGDILAELGRDAEASELLERVADEARLVTDDMATCLLAPTSGVTAGGFRIEQLELAADELSGNITSRFLEACGVAGGEAARVEVDVADIARRYGGAVLEVHYGIGAPRIVVTPRNVESIEASSRRAAAS